MDNRNPKAFTSATISPNRTFLEPERIFCKSFPLLLIVAINSHNLPPSQKDNFHAEVTTCDSSLDAHDAPWPAPSSDRIPTGFFFQYPRTGDRITPVVISPHECMPIFFFKDS